MRRALVLLSGGLLAVHAAVQPWSNGRAALHDMAQGVDTSITTCPAWIGNDYYIVDQSGACLACNVFDDNCWDSPIPTSPGSASLFTLGTAAGVVVTSAPAVQFPHTTNSQHTAVVTLRSTAVNAANDFTILSPESDYTWADFDTNRNNYVWSKLNPATMTPGVYVAQVEAWQPVNLRSGICQLCFSVSDHFRPRSTTPCPASTGDFTKVGWPENVGTLTAYLTSVQAFVTSFVNNACSSPVDASCQDVVQVTGSDWFGCPLNLAVAEFKSPSQFFQKNFAATCVATKLVENPFLSAAVLASPELTLSPAKCTRTVSFEYTWKEFWVEYRCGQPSVSHCSGGADGAAGGDATSTANANSNFQCKRGPLTLAATANNLVTSVSMSANTVALSANALYIPGPVTTFPSLGYSSTRQIHFWSTPATAAFNGDLVPLLIPIQSLFTPQALGNAIAGLTLPTVSQLVFWRWRVGTTWRDFAQNDKVTLSSLATVVTFEAWTQCGIKAVDPAISWTVYNHRRQTIPNVDEWFQGNWKFPTASDAHCNVRDSDFAALTFRYDATELQTKVTNWTFQSMKCSWMYGTLVNNVQFAPSAQSWPLVPTGVSNEVVETTFAPKLLNRPVTQLSTYCDLTFFSTAAVNGIAVTIFVGAFLGESKSYGVGSYNLDGNFLVNVNSFVVSPGFEVVFYKQLNQQGIASAVYQFDTPLTTFVNWNPQSFVARTAVVASVLTLFADPLYKGTSAVFGIGTSDLATGLAPSSLQLATGFQVTAYDQRNQRGNSIVFTANSYILPTAWDNRILSVAVDVVASADVVTIYLDANYLGASLSFGVGDFALPTAFRNTVSSIKLAAGYKLTIFTSPAWTGTTTVTYTATSGGALWMPTLGTWDNRGQSLRIAPAVPPTSIVHTYSSITHWFETCDAPSWTGAFYSNAVCEATCMANSWKTLAARVAAPFQACAGNLIYPASPWDATALPVATVLDVGATRGCCRDCDVSLVPGFTAVTCAGTTVSAAISRCQPGGFTTSTSLRVTAPATDDPSLTLLLSLAKVATMLKGLIVGVVVVGVVAVLRGTRQLRGGNEYWAHDSTTDSLTTAFLE
ncbi:hypothetical protein H257_03023 [Aphanomyces astaci]|uniref:Uncharacterized protein n=1 Tax=Aphanomyces astaci TaxID=112090 RepID=W4H215_APHAT|nr:hypothetical protein H257_03023 [Aphanomyces astaci]ETV85203.1 hypothetical protein H257_03023 [Aphanomyces astaci]|eukprot:XP_009825221.1 hypothetical protein H257_03023 [Aphanomyces astaci]